MTGIEPGRNPGGLVALVLAGDGEVLAEDLLTMDNAAGAAEVSGERASAWLAEHGGPVALLVYDGDSGELVQRVLVGQGPAAYVCPVCGSRSAHPRDGAERYCGRCHVFAEHLLTPRCPLCSSEPAIVLDGGHQAICPRDDCRAFMWDMFKHVDELLTEFQTLDLPDLGGPGGTA